jgi:hypothetical protein
MGRCDRVAKRGFLPNGRGTVADASESDICRCVSYQVGSHVSYHYLTCGRGSVFFAVMSPTVEQKTNYQGFPKPGELIEMTGTHALEASDRAILNLLYQHAHDSGKLLDPNAEWEVPLSVIRQSYSKHESSDRLRDSLNRLMSVKVNVAYVAEAENGEPGPEKRVVITGLFDFFDVSAKELATRATLRYGLPRKLAPVLETSGRWGRIKAEIVCSMTEQVRDCPL